MHVTPIRRVAGAACAALLTAGLAGCSSLGRTAVGPVDHTTSKGRVVQVSSPAVTGCHRFGPTGARAVHNGSLVDLVAYPSPDCAGAHPVYIATTLTNTISPHNPPWRSYRFVH
ncbi:hypothetical protein AB0910_23980 [Streptomyces sp. NPDC047002]|uniref:hypothetical protein n=1 Tax=Streptomyces sp. NPDC047002 TaxID=3155475 RepID=UPI0034546344